MEAAVVVGGIKMVVSGSNIQCSVLRFYGGSRMAENDQGQRLKWMVAKVYVGVQKDDEQVVVVLRGWCLVVLDGGFGLWYGDIRVARCGFLVVLGVFKVEGSDGSLL